MSLLWIKFLLIMFWIFWPTWCRQQWKRIKDIERLPKEREYTELYKTTVVKEYQFMLKEGSVSIPSFADRRFSKIRSDAEWDRIVHLYDQKVISTGEARKALGLQ